MTLFADSLFSYFLFFDTLHIDTYTFGQSICILVHILCDRVITSLKLNIIIMIDVLEIKKIILY